MSKKRGLLYGVITSSYVNNLAIVDKWYRELSEIVFRTKSKEIKKMFKSSHKRGKITGNNQ